jgi:NTP pyrophosphatase (non-canonical NTP hydrolase)
MDTQSIARWWKDWLTMAGNPTMAVYSGSEDFSRGSGEMRQFQVQTRETAEYQDGCSMLSDDLVNNKMDLDEWLRLTYLVTKLASEAGEVAGVMGKFCRDDYGPEEFRRRLVKETGDVLWYIARIHDELDIDMGVEAQELIARLRRRKANGKIKGDGSDR